MHIAIIEKTRPKTNLIIAGIKSCSGYWYHIKSNVIAGKQNAVGIVINNDQYHAKPKEINESK